MNDTFSRFLQALRQSAVPCPCKIPSCPNARCEHCMCQGNPGGPDVIKFGKPGSPERIAWFSQGWHALHRGTSLDAAKDAVAARFRVCCKCGHHEPADPAQPPATWRGERRTEGY